MNILEITLKEDGSVEQFTPDFKIMRGSYGNVLININVPRTLIVDTVSDGNNSQNNTGNSVCIGAIISTATGQNLQTKKYEFVRIREFDQNEINYALYQRKMPKEFTMWETVNTLETAREGKLRMVINVVNWIMNGGEIKIEEISASPIFTLDIYPSAYLDTEEIIEPSEFSLLYNQVQDLAANIVQETGQSTTAVMSQKAVTDAIEGGGGGTNYTDTELILNPFYYYTFYNHYYYRITESLVLEKYPNAERVDGQTFYNVYELSFPNPLSIKSGDELIITYEYFGKYTGANPWADTQYCPMTFKSKKIFGEKELDMGDGTLLPIKVAESANDITKYQIVKCLDDGYQKQPSKTIENSLFMYAEFDGKVLASFTLNNIVFLREIAVHTPTNGNNYARLYQEPHRFGDTGKDYYQSAICIISIVWRSYNG